MFVQGPMEETILMTSEPWCMYKLPTLEKRRNCHLNNFMYKRNSNLVMNEDNDILTRSRTSKKIIVNKPNIEAYKRSIAYSGASRWNALEK